MDKEKIRKAADEVFKDLGPFIERVEFPDGLYGYSIGTGNNRIITGEGGKALIEKAIREEMQKEHFKLSKKTKDSKPSGKNYTKPKKRNK